MSTVTDSKNDNRHGPTTGPTLVQLINGEWVHSDAEAWRDECLAKYVLALPTLIERRAWLADFEKRHGAGEAERLKYQMLQQKQGRS